MYYIMPLCINNKTLKAKSRYTGKEPSPKGLGYCAHNENLNKLRKGKDGNYWRVKKTSNGIRRWVKVTKTKKAKKSSKK